METQDDGFNQSQIDFLSLLDNMGAAFGERTISSMAESCSPFLKKLTTFCPVRSAAAFGGLLLLPEYQIHCLRIELLIHMAIAVGNGKRPLLPELMVQGFHVTGEAVGMLEDPPENVFVENIYSKIGNYKVLSGIWEGGGFYLQRFVNVIDEMPKTGGYDGVFNAAHALLKVSDLLCSRANLRRNQSGADCSVRNLPLRTAKKSSELRKLVSLSNSDLLSIGVDIKDLRPFIFDPELRYGLAEQSFGNTDLERRPLAMLDNTLHLVLPTAVSLAIRSWCLRMFDSPNESAALRFNLAIEYAHFIHDGRLLTAGQPLQFTHEHVAPLAHLNRIVDTGRWLNMIFMVDSLQGFNNGGFTGFDESAETIATDVAQIVARAQEQAAQDSNFVSGITLLVCCGVGRSIGISMDVPARADWKIEAISIHDLHTLTSINSFKTLDLWRLWESEARLDESNVWLQNANGLLNLYAWASALNGHMVPHAEMPPDASETKVIVSITQNGLLDLRQKALRATDEHAQAYVDGTWFVVRKEQASYFEEDDLKPLYGSVNAPGRPKGAFLTSKRCWWCELASPAGGPYTESYDRWKMLGTWLIRSALVLEDALEQQLGHGPILWRCVFMRPSLAADLSKWGSEAGAKAAIRSVLYPQLRTVELIIDQGFDEALYHPENIAERALVRAFVEAIVMFAGVDSGIIEPLVSHILPNAHARHAHIFSIQTYRDAITELSTRPLIMISRMDDAIDCLGMGWRVRGRESGGRITGKKECLAYFSHLVRYLQQDLCMQLQRFNREDLVRALLENHEVACVSRDRWHRTAAAVLALREDQVSTLSAMRDHEFSLNGVLQPSRNLLEIALCESHLHSGRLPGKLDIAKLLAKAARLFHLGGWSDLIRWDLMEPVVLIQSLGDVHVQQDFIDRVVDSYGSATSGYRYQASARRYNQNLKPYIPVGDSRSDIDSRFTQAWLEEFELDLDVYRRFFDAIEDYGIAQQQAVFVIPRSQVLAWAESPEIGQTILNKFVLVTRAVWANVPAGYDQKDIDPWRFRRQLSTLRRPILQLNLEADPSLVFAPGLVREGFAATVQNYYSGTYSDRHLGVAMRRYAGYARERDGMAFNAKVLARLGELGWQTKAELKLTKILRRSLDRDYGDVDVLAWNVELKRILVIECKNLQFRKTYGEIAEQLSDFRGMEIDGKRDLLKKHLDRVGVLREYQTLLGSFVGMSDNFTVESIVVFSFPVPMQFTSGPIREQAHLFTFSTLADL